MSKQITITNVKNANELDSFVPVDGCWTYDDTDSSNTLSEADIEESVQNYMGAPYKVSVQVFHSNGHAITGDMPSSGTFIATRK